MTGVKEVDRSLEKWQFGSPGPAPAVDSDAGAQGGGALARCVAIGPRLDRYCYGRGSLPGPAYHQQTGVCLQCGRPWGPDIRADRGAPALDQGQQEKLKAAVQQPPAAPGIELANWF